MNEMLFILRVVGALALLFFVGSVGWWLYGDMARAAEQLAAQQRPTAALLVLATQSVGLAEGMVLPLLPVTGIGRNPSNTIVIEDEYASGEHLLIALRGPQWWLEDLGSRNGTLLNGQPLRQAAVISIGDVITIGHTSLKMVNQPAND